MPLGADEKTMIVNADEIQVGLSRYSGLFSLSLYMHMFKGGDNSNGDVEEDRQNDGGRRKLKKKDGVCVTRIGIMLAYKT